MLTDVLLKLGEPMDVFTHFPIEMEQAHTLLNLIDLTLVKDGDHVLKHLHVKFL
jgi:hypothetical protein